MTGLLVKLFVKNYEQAQLPEVRHPTESFRAWWGLCVIYYCLR